MIHNYYVDFPQKSSRSVLGSPTYQASAYLHSFIG